MYEPTPLPEPKPDVKPYVLPEKIIGREVRIAMLKKLDSMMRRHRDMKRGLGVPYDREPMPVFFISQPALLALHQSGQAMDYFDFQMGEDGVWRFKGFPVFIINSHYMIVECHENQSEILYA